MAKLVGRITQTIHRTAAIIAVCSATVVMAVSCEDIIDENSESDSSSEQSTGRKTTWPKHPFTQPQKPWIPSERLSFEDGEAENSSIIQDDEYCSASDFKELLNSILTADIIPDASIGGIGFWSIYGRPNKIEALLGPSSQGMFCSPHFDEESTWSWGEKRELEVHFDTFTHRILALNARSGYKGVLSARYTSQTGLPIDISLGPDRYVKINELELNAYASFAAARFTANSWLNPNNINSLYRAIAHTYFPNKTPGTSSDCTISQSCLVSYQYTDQSKPQRTRISFPDFGIYITFEPNGRVSSIFLEPVRKTSFQERFVFDFGGFSSASITPQLTSLSVPGCNIPVNMNLKWEDFKRLCIESQAQDPLPRQDYSMSSLQDSTISFDGLVLRFSGTPIDKIPTENGSYPQDNSKLYELGFRAELATNVLEYIPYFIALQFASEVNKKLSSSLVSTSTAAISNHPFNDYKIPVPLFAISSGPMVPLVDPVSNQNWVASTIKQIQNDYMKLPSAQKQMVDPDLLSDVVFNELFLQSTLLYLTHGMILPPNPGQILYRTTEDNRYLVARAHFLQREAGNKLVPYRLELIYNQESHHIAWVNIGVGHNDMDTISNENNTTSLVPSDYPAAFHMEPSIGGFLSIGQNTVRDLRPSNTPGYIKATIYNPLTATSFPIVVQGEYKADDGYLKQTGGSQFVFEPAHRLELRGRETTLILYVGNNGNISRAVMPDYKGPHILCAPPNTEFLFINYGADVPKTIEAWKSRVSKESYDWCSFAFNYSSNGQILQGVASLTYQSEVYLINNRSVTAARWE